MSNISNHIYAILNKNLEYLNQISPNVFKEKSNDINNSTNNNVSSNNDVILSAVNNRLLTPYDEYITSHINKIGITA